MPVEEWNPSPNFSSREGRKIIAIVDHITQGAFPGCMYWLQNPVSKASSNYVVTKLGRIIQLVKEGDKAWANGIVAKPNWKIYDGTNPNLYTISIEHEGMTGDELTEAQYQATLFLHKELTQKYNIPIDTDHIIGHYRIDSVKKANCPGTGFPWDRLFNDLKGGPVTILKAPEPSRGSAPQQHEPAPAPPVVALNFTYPNNAKCVNDDLLIRDANGTVIAGRQVDKGDRITVLDVGFTKQLTFVEYPTPSGVRNGFVNNKAGCIQYDHHGAWHNGKTSETVYVGSNSDSKLGSLNPHETATLLYKSGSRYHVVYDTDKGADTKSGYVNYSGGL